MRVFIDSSIFLRLFLDEPGADRAQEILEAVESNRLVGYVTPLVLEETVFKLMYARASEILGTVNIWRIREALARDSHVQSRVAETVDAFRDYIDYMLARGLRVEHVDYTDWLKALDYVKRYGLLPADALHVAVALRLGIDTIATFDSDFKRVKELRTIP